MINQIHIRLASPINSQQSLEIGQSVIGVHPQMQVTEVVSRVADYLEVPAVVLGDMALDVTEQGAMTLRPEATYG